jgi:hypothetical protein
VNALNRRLPVDPCGRLVVVVDGSESNAVLGDVAGEELYEKEDEENQPGCRRKRGRKSPPQPLDAAVRAGQRDKSLAHLVSENEEDQDESKLNDLAPNDFPDVETGFRGRSLLESNDQLEVRLEKARSGSGRSGEGTYRRRRTLFDLFRFKVAIPPAYRKVTVASGSGGAVGGRECQYASRRDCWESAEGGRTCSTWQGGGKGEGR